MRYKNNIFEVDHTNKDKKQLFIDAAICSLANHGYKGTTVRQIAKYAKVTPGLLTHYYAGKEVLIAESYKYLAKQFLVDFQEKLTVQKTDPVHALKVFIENVFEPENMGPKFLRVWLAFWTLTLTEPELRGAHKEIFTQYIQSLEELLDQAYSLDENPKITKNTRSLAIGIFALLDGMWLESCLDPDTFSHNENLEVIYAFVESATGLNINKN